MKYNFKLAKQVWRIKLPPAEREVLRVLCEHADDNNIAFPSRETIAMYTDMSVRNVQRMLNSLTEAEIITRVQGAKGGRSVHVMYQIDLSKGHQKLGFPALEQASDNSDKLAQNTAKKSAKLASLSDPKNDNLSPYLENKDNLAQNTSIEGQSVTVSEEQLEHKEGQICSETVTNLSLNSDKSGFACKEEHTFEHTFEHTHVSDPPSATRKSARSSLSKKSSSPKPKRQPDPLVEIFKTLFLTRGSGIPYAPKVGDYVQLANLRKRLAAEDWEVTPERFEQAAQNYFASALGSFTLAALCTRFDDFYRAQLDRFGQPVTASPSANGSALDHRYPNNGLQPYGQNQQLPRETHNARAARKTFERIEALRVAAGGFDCPDPDGTETPWTPVD